MLGAPPLANKLSAQLDRLGIRHQQLLSYRLIISVSIQARTCFAHEVVQSQDPQRLYFLHLLSSFLGGGCPTGLSNLAWEEGRHVGLWHYPSIGNVAFRRFGASNAKRILAFTSCFNGEERVERCHRYRPLATVHFLPHYTFLNLFVVGCSDINLVRIQFLVLHSDVVFQGLGVVLDILHVCLAVVEERRWHLVFLTQL